MSGVIARRSPALCRGIRPHARRGSITDLSNRCALTGVEPPDQSGVHTGRSQTPKEALVSDALNRAYDHIDRSHSHRDAATRRNFVAGAAATIGGMGLLGVADVAAARDLPHRRSRPEFTGNLQEILNTAASVEVLATCINTLAHERGTGEDDVTKRNVAAAGRHELLHHDELVSEFGARPVATRVWIPDAIFASKTNLLRAVQNGDGIFINIYLIMTTIAAQRGNGLLARAASEIMGVEAVHRALARQSLGLLGNDRAFIRFRQPETAEGAPDLGRPGFTDVSEAFVRLEAAGIGFDKQTSAPGQFYDFAELRQRTPNPPDVNTLKLD